VYNAGWAVKMNTPRDVVFRGNLITNDLSVGGCLISCHDANGLTYVSNAVTAVRGRVCFYGTGAAGVVKWEGNSQPRPEVRKEPPRDAVKVVSVRSGPSVDGDLDLSVWPSEFHALTRRADGTYFGGAYGVLRCCRHGTTVHLAVQLCSFRWEGVGDRGHVWRRHDGVELSIGSVRIRGYADGTLEIPAALAAAGVRGYAGKPKRYFGNGQQRVIQFAIPLAAIGFECRSGVEIPFNVAAYQAVHDEMRYFEGLSSDGLPSGRLLLSD